MLLVGSVKQKHVERQILPYHVINLLLHACVARSQRDIKQNIHRLPRSKQPYTVIITNMRC